MRLWKIAKNCIKLITLFILLMLVLIVSFAALGVRNCPLAVSPLANTALPATAMNNAINDYHRPLASTYLIFPEWYIVYSSKEYANFLKDHKPSDFPYFASIEQYWCAYHTVYSLTKDLPFNTEDHLMLAVIGISFSAEYIVKGAYENTIGKLSEWSSKGEAVEEDKYAQKVAQEYVEFIPEHPWFEFAFAERLTGLWRETSWYGPHMIRKWERKFILSAEYAFKAFYGWVMGLGSHATLGAASDYIYATIKLPSTKVLDQSNIKLIKRVENNKYIITLPHEQPFTDSVTNLSKTNAEFIDIAGNRDILLTVISPLKWKYDLKDGNVLFTMSILTDPTQHRIAIQVPVNSLLNILNQLLANGIYIEHVYDY